MEQSGQQTRGLEVIGQLRPFGRPPSTDVHSRFIYGTEGARYDYVYKLGGSLAHWFDVIVHTRQVTPARPTAGTPG